jgi:uncharacterized repeat protein (TIGR01451 family)
VSVAAQFSGIEPVGTEGRAARLSAALRHCGTALIAISTSLYTPPALADPATNAVAPNFSQTTAGAIATTVPDGICAVITSTRGGAGASSGVAATNGGAGGGGAIINARFNVLPGQAIAGMVGSGGLVPATVNSANNGTGTANGGSAGNSSASFLLHRGGGGGGSSSISVAGIKMVEAGGGGGGGASHGAITVANGGTGGITGIAAGTVATGVSGVNGADGATTVNGGAGGATAVGGAGGTGAGTLSGLAGSGIGTGTGGNGGANDPNTDTGGGGGGGYTGGGGGASTTNSSSVSAGGGGGGSSFVRGTSPTPAAPVPTAVSGLAGAATAGGPTSGAAGFVYLDYVPCVYTLAVSKTASAASVNAGQAVRWTITVRNSGTQPMTRGDTVTLADTLPTGGGSTFKVVSITSTPGSTDPDMASGAITCTGLSVGGTMPASTDCSRPYSAPSAPGAPSGGSGRGLNAGETLTIVYDQIFNNAIPAATVSNVASATDRSSTTVVGSAPNTDTQGAVVVRKSTASVNVLPYDLKVTKSASSATVGVSTAMTWTVNVTNLGPGDMFGPDAIVANPLIVSDVAPTTNVSAPVSFTSTGPAGSCTYASGTITCPSGLASGATQTFTFQQTVNAAAPAGATVSNTASVTDYFAGDTNDSAPASFTITPSSNLVTVKTRTSATATPSVGNTVSYQIQVTNNGPSATTNVKLTDTLPAGLTAAGGNGVVSQGSYVAGTGLWTIGSLANGASATLALVGTVNIGQGGSTITNNTTAASTPDQPDPTTTGDDLTEVVTALLPAIVATPDSVTGINGASGAANVLNVLGGDTLNAVAATTGTVLISQTAAASHPGVTLATASGNVSVAAGTPAGTYTIGYRICEIANPTNCANSTATVTVNPSADLRIVKSNGVSTVVSGSTVTYTVTATNAGADAITGAIVTDVVGSRVTCPAGNTVTITGSGVPAGAYTIANLTGAGIALGTLASGQSAILTYSCQVT